ncbi:MAG: RNA polymerase sigma factor [Verrucomicrobiota bacterium]
MAKNPNDASDLVQQTFYIYAEKGSSLRDASKVKTWLFTTLYREFLRRRRKGQRQDHYEPEVLEEVGGSVEPEVRRNADGEMALRALEQIDEVYRAPLTLFYLKDLSYKEIADVLEIPIGTVMSRLSRGKNQLRELLTAQQQRA